MTDGRAGAAATGAGALLARTARAALGVAALCALCDLWQVALANPASIAARAVLVLVGAYVAGSLVLVGVPLLVVWLLRRRAFEPAVPAVGAVAVAAWMFFLAQGVALRALPSASTWRTPVVLALALLAVALVWPLRRVATRPAPVWLLGLGWALVAVGAVGAVRGFTHAATPANGGAGRAATEAAGARPNVLLITIDTLRADHLTSYGYTRPTSPVLDGLAAEGVLFARAYSQSSWTKPATASLLTSQYPSMHQTNLELSRIPEPEVLLPEALHDGGYTTAVLSGNPWVTSEYGFNQGVDRFYSIYDERFARVTLLMQALKRANAKLYDAAKRLVQGKLRTTARDEQVEAEAERWIGANRDRPFFAYLHLMSAHPPYDPPPPFDTMFNKHPQFPPVTNHPKTSYFFGQRADPLPDEQLADMVARYDGGIRFGDGVVGKLIAALRSLDLLDATVVVVTADHGEEFYDHGNWGHGHSVYNELLHVPLIVRYPARFPRGVRVDSTVMTIDVMPTILELTGIRSQAPIAGRSLIGLANGDGSTHPAEAYSELIYRYGTGRSLIEDDKKLIETVVGDDRHQELYDLHADPEERWQIVPAETPRLLARLQEVSTWAERRRVDAAEATVTEEARKRVEALGYVN